ncbi:hypothetical protein ECHHL_0970 [Ehrlichia chaffeensis str. Heartland]|uniref:Uncharacterized protein n=1 Tax=Ehrlichia chaffeensis (strain ATCC CRL-10679 / Arkansas) TaxID=205920 RepID=Q2GI10_EHRCR|nr:hypothetical protein ECH_0094 [Ehrlichia chaffeensis str. Arkansas]AHX04097.1 hypothetical protein ECHHL_0970 [Ehrlichia chaffeensis str. Heartland]AHX06033.1 hypothetical protein ECHJAX_0991 [Ehrlichia chaffeensis str. Jax]AHX07023.1 hypothetical protein ECHLIB_0992 [Ehrlichia chaffeensis str. Liberty]AHX07610.1 hypothetical protein ECHOSC_0985 [Ehrlichia chaffeensis str. Osceola]AHX09006.1 hypothetical protein ECHSTV_0973 [Ehrlichia chaffeensis str. Saint Vincent]AHX09978.1 hypothetical 
MYGDIVSKISLVYKVFYIEKDNSIMFNAFICLRGHLYLYYKKYNAF